MPDWLLKLAMNLQEGRVCWYREKQTGMGTEETAPVRVVET